MLRSASECLLDHFLVEVHVVFGKFHVVPVHHEATLVIAPGMQALLYIFTQVDILYVQNMAEQSISFCSWSLGSRLSRK